jgi:DNA-directed RNA polymerase specialized sigma24 family protein
MPSETNSTDSSIRKKDIRLLTQKQRETFITNLYDTYSSALYSYILKIVPDKEKAASVLYATFVEAYEAFRAKEDKNSNLFIWLLNTSRNTAIEMLIEMQCVKESITTTNGEVSIDNIFFKAFLFRLPMLEKAILSLIYYRNYFLADIAKLLKVPLCLVETKLHIAKQKFEDEYILNSSASHDDKKTNCH